ncbi:MAG: regulatory protein RecX [Clostridiaceae bacterium]|nr:regulatory protein RecX [Clostridiaceae bacterium]
MKKISLALTAEPLSEEERAWNRCLQEARSKAIAFLGLSKKPSGQVAARLQAQSFSREVIQAVLAELQADGYLDDYALAKRIIGQRQGRQAEAKSALRRRLMTKGLAAESVELALQEASDDRESANALLDQRFGAELSGMTGETVFQDSTLQKMARFLMSRGYNPELVEQILIRRFRH